jgi:hypothetical protein
MSVSGQTRELASLISLPLPPAQFFVATLGARLLAFDADAVQGSLATEDVGATGGVTVEGILYKSVDLMSRMALPADADDLNGPVLLLSHGGLYGCIRVGRLHGPVEREPAQVLPFPLHFRGAEQEWYRGMILFEHSVAMVLNSAWILEEAKSGQDAANLERPREALQSVTAYPDLVSSKVQEC